MSYRDEVAPLDTTSQKNLIAALLLDGKEEIYPASLPQERLWFLDQLRNQHAAYNVHVGLWLNGTLAENALRAALGEIVARHDSFRTKFRFEDGNLAQVVAPALPVRIATDDVTAAADPIARAYQIACDEVHAPFDLAEGPLFRARLMRVSPEDHVFVCTMHHIVTDSWSMQLFVKELTTLYTAFSTGNSSPLTELPVRYGDYAEWQRECFSSENIDNQIAYWKDKLKHAPALLRLPTDSKRPAEQTFAGASQTTLIPDAVVAKIKKLAAAQQCTPFMVLLAAFKTLLARYSGQTDVLVGVPVAGRNSIETESLIGFFVNTLVLRDNLSGNPRFIEVLAQVRETTLGAFANAEVPFEKIVEVLQPERNLSYNPLFQVMFSSIKAAVQSHVFGDLTAYPYVVSTNSSIFDLSATLIEATDGQWYMQFEYNTDLFAHERIQRMLADYGRLLENVAERPEIRVGQIAVTGQEQLSALPQQAEKTAESDPPADTALAGRSDFHEKCEQLLEIWKKVLGVASLGIHDNFFDMGGHSLLAARLIREIEKATGQRIRVSAIFRAPTIAAFARLMPTQTPGPDPIAMELRRGIGAQALFGVAIPGVETFGFGMLAHHMCADCSVYKLQASAPVILDRPFSTQELQSLAERYVAAMRAVQPEGPYALAAMCDGALLAQAMIVLLEKQGVEVSLFTVFDTWVLENSMRPLLWTLDYYHQRLQRYLAASSHERWQTIKGIAGRLLGGGRTEDERGWKRAYWPGEGFHPPRFHAPVLLFKRRRQPFYYVRDPQMGWGGRTSGGVEIYVIDGGHVDMLRDPYVRRVAERISSRIASGKTAGRLLAVANESFIREAQRCVDHSAA